MSARPYTEAVRIPFAAIVGFAALLVVVGALVFFYALRTNPAGGLIFLSCMVAAGFATLFGLIWATPNFGSRRDEVDALRGVGD